ncbi:MAG: GIY-YIG nuclease family protein [Beijerinckiaceae bacterium]|nr:GIY-YIG nuclease family protein [Beijerinckiaceae bacterium]
MKSAPVSNAPRDTLDLRQNLQAFLDSDFADPATSTVWKVGNFQWGVYCFYDYDGEPIYVGQTNEKLRTRIRRHLTNQRTDAVAMSVLDPFEVLDVEVWPLPQFQGANRTEKTAIEHLNALESQIVSNAIAASKFAAILNEKDPPQSKLVVAVPRSFRMRIVSRDLYEIRKHPDVRAARRAQVIARLSQVIAEREVRGGLRRALWTQTKRLNWLAEQRYLETGGSASVEQEDKEP